MKVGIAGLGRMGKGMANTLLRNGVEVCGYDINLKSIEKFMKVKSFTTAEKVSDLYICDFVILSLPTGTDVVNIIEHYDGRAIILDTTTISLKELQKIKTTLGKNETNYLTCKLERGPKEANEGKLAIFVGGNRQLYEKSDKIIGILGEHIFIGTHEQATMLKLISNMVGTAIVDIFGEISVLIRKLKIDPASASKALSMGGASSVSQMFRLDWQARNDFGESFSLQLAQHVIDMALESARNAGVSDMPVIEQNNLMMKLAMKMGIGKQDVSEISKMYWDLNNTEN